MTISKININDKIKRDLLLNRLISNGLSWVQFINQPVPIANEYISIKLMLYALKIVILSINNPFIVLIYNPMFDDSLMF